MIKVEHSYKLFEAVKNDNKVIVNPPNMTHNDFNLDTDLLVPLKKFVKNIDEHDEDTNKKSHMFGSTAQTKISLDLDKLQLFKRFI